MAIYGVLIRQVKNNRPVTTGVFKDPGDLSAKNIDDYFTSEAKDTIKSIVKNIPEFSEATWYLDVFDTNFPLKIKTINIG